MRVVPKHSASPATPNGQRAWLIERTGNDEDSKPSGWLSGDTRANDHRTLLNWLPRPTLAQQRDGTRAFFRTLNAMGITGVLDPGGYNLEIADYQALFQVWREHGLTVRVRYSLSAPRRDHELEDFQALTQVLPMGLGDDWLRFNGIGENVTWGLYNNDHPSDAQKAQLHEVLRWAVARGMTATFHWNNERAVHHLLDVLARVNTETPIAKLRWSIAHLNDASPQTLQRMKTMGLGWLVQNAFYFRGEAFLGQRGVEAARLVPPHRQRAAAQAASGRRHRRAPRNGSESLRLVAMDARRQNRFRCCHARGGGTAVTDRSAASLYARQRLVQLRRERARCACRRTTR